jgi:hypothetical protein
MRKKSKNNPIFKMTFSEWAEILDVLRYRRLDTTALSEHLRDTFEDSSTIIIRHGKYRPAIIIIDGSPHCEISHK